MIGDQLANENVAIFSLAQSSFEVEKVEAQGGKEGLLKKQAKQEVESNGIEIGTI